MGTHVNIPSSSRYFIDLCFVSMSCFIYLEVTILNKRRCNNHNCIIVRRSLKHMYINQYLSTGVSVNTRLSVDLDMLEYPKHTSVDAQVSRYSRYTTFHTEGSRQQHAEVSQTHGYMLLNVGVFQNTTAGFFFTENARLQTLKCRTILDRLLWTPSRGACQKYGFWRLTVGLFQTIPFRRPHVGLFHTLGCRHLKCTHVPGVWM